MVKTPKKSPEIGCDLGREVFSEGGADSVLVIGPGHQQ